MSADPFEWKCRQGGRTARLTDHLSATMDGPIEVWKSFEPILQKTRTGQNAQTILTVNMTAQKLVADIIFPDKD